MNSYTNVDRSVCVWKKERERERYEPHYHDIKGESTKNNTTTETAVVK